MKWQSLWRHSLLSVCKSVIFVLRSLKGQKIMVWQCQHQWKTNQEENKTVKNFIHQISYVALLDLHSNCGHPAPLLCCGKDVDTILNKAYHLRYPIPPPSTHHLFSLFPQKILKFFREETFCHLTTLPWSRLNLSAALTQTIP